MRYRKIILSSLLAMIMTTTVFANNYKVQVRGNQINTVIKVIDNRSMIGLRDVGEALGLDVRYDGETNRVLLDITYENMANLLVLDLKTGLADTVIWGDGNLYHYERQKLKLEVQPKMIEGKVYVPLRFVCDVFGSPISVSGDNIAIGDIFSSGLVTARLDNQGTQKKIGPNEEISERYLRDVAKLIETHDEVEYYVRKVTLNPYDYMGNDGYYMWLELMDLFSLISDLPMETKEGEKAKETYGLMALNLANQCSDLKEYKIPKKDRTDALLRWIDVLGADLQALDKKMASLK